MTSKNSLMEEAESLLLHQFTHSPKLKGLVRALVKPFQEVLNLIHELHHGGYIDKASAQRLNVLGDIIGQPRKVMNDDDYRAWIDVGIRLNISAGTPEDVLAILNILYRQKPNFLMHEYQPNDVVFTLLSLPMAPLQAAFDIVRSATPATTVCHFVRADKEPSFRFDATAFSSSYFADYFEEDIPS
jgi:hypothetical protein